MEKKKKLPIGIEGFIDFSSEDFYYVDKTGFIIDLLHNWGKVNLFTRPRRFGKSLNISMLQAFFEIGCDKNWFEGLKVSTEKELCQEYMGKFPVISISLKDVEGRTFEAARSAMKNVIGNEAMRFQFLKKSPMLSEEEKELYKQLIEIDKTHNEVYAMSDAALSVSLKTLSFLLQKHYGHDVILLIDEYDVPLDKAFQAGYYDEMVSLVRTLFSNGLKTNPCLQFAVLTGCLRVSRESIFTGLNNFNVLSITEARFDEYFGFTDLEVKELLSYYHLDSFYDTIREWYDGYRFGNASLYCPWDVVRYCYVLLADNTRMPENYWANTSSNSIVRQFIDKANKKTRDEIEKLIAGETIVKELRPELTYQEIDDSIENLWSALFTTGYLTQRERLERNQYQLAIPNLEIRALFISQIREWFRESTCKDAPKLDAFCEAFPAGDARTIEQLLNEYLWNTISIRDTASAKEQKENFYHGILLGLLRHKENWLVQSNAESGEGYSDILVEVPESRTGIVIEMKYAEGGKLEEGCTEALKQIEDKKYETRLVEDGMQVILKYGISCFKKYCKIVVK